MRAGGLDQTVALRIVAGRSNDGLKGSLDHEALPSWLFPLLTHWTLSEGKGSRYGYLADRLCRIRTNLVPLTSRPIGHREHICRLQRRSCR